MTTPTSKSYLEAWQSDMAERQRLEDRIAELEESLEIAKDSRAVVDQALHERRMQVETLRAENQRLHAAARATVLEWRKDIWPGDEHKCFMNNRMEELAALVGEKV